MNSCKAGFLFVLVVFGITIGCLHQKSEAGIRAVRINYRLTLTIPDNEPTEVKAWVPVPRQTPFQKISGLNIEGGRLYKEPEYGNRFIYLGRGNAVSETITIGFNCIVERVEQKAYKSNRENPVVLNRFLQPDRLVTMSARVRKLAEQITYCCPDDLAKARAIYEFVLQKMRYDKSRPACSLGDTEFAFDTGMGNCTNFHSLFISLARSSGIPAKFVIGYSISGEKRGMLQGYHCWVEFYLKEYGWIPADISEAWKHPEKRGYFFGNVDENRILFTEGRDIMLNPPQESGRLNYMIYPYLEINGRPSDKYDLKITYDDNEADYVK